jgi:hypothetical protein
MAMAESSRGEEWVTEVITALGLKLLANLITIVRLSLPAQPTLQWQHPLVAQPVQDG